MGVYVFFKLLGFQISYTLPKTKISDRTFIKIMLLSMSVMLLVGHYILSAYGVWLLPKTVYIGVGILYILLFVILFWEWSFKDVVWYFKSRKFKRFVASNTYNILSLLVILTTLGGLSYKFGYFDGILKKEASVEVVEEIPEVVEEIVEEIPEVEEPETITVIRRIGNIYNFTNRLELWSDWDEVSKLQEFMNTLWYLETEPTGDFDETTRLALRDTLRGECEWPESTRWILGVQAMACINSIEYTEEVTIGNEEAQAAWNTWEEEISESEVQEEEVPVAEIVIEEPEVIEEAQEEVREEPEVIEEAPVEPNTSVEEVIVEEPEVEEASVEEIVIEEPEAIEEAQEIPDNISIRTVSDLYIFTETLSVWSTGNQVFNLKDILTVLGYYNWDLDNAFDESTRVALRSALIDKCDWPVSTKWILGPQARTCINTLPIPLP